MESLLAARIDQLDLRSRRALRDLAVLGSEVPRAAVAELLPPDAAANLDRLAATTNGLISFQALPEATFTFVDNGVRTVAVAGLPRSRARKLHAAMARWLEHRPVPNIDLVAAQWCGSGEVEGILRWAPIAARRAKRIGATHAATQWLLSALEATQLADVSAPTRAALSRELADVAQLAGLLDVEARALRVALTASPPEQAHAIQVERAANARRSGRHRAAAAMLGRVPMSAVDPATSAAAVLEHARQAQWRGNWRRALHLAQQGVEAARAAQDSVSEHGAWTIVTHSLQAMGHANARTAADAALASARASGDQHLVAIAIGNIAMIDDNHGRWTAAARGYRRSIELFDRCGDVVNAAYGRLAVASILLELGDTEAAEQQSRAAARVMAAATVPADQVAAAESVATVAVLRRGGLADADVTRHLDLQRERSLTILSADPELGGFQLAREIETLLLAGRAGSALDRLAELDGLAKGFDDHHLLPAMVRRLRAIAFLASGRRDAAAAAAGEAWDRAASFGHRYEQPALAGVLAALGTDAHRVRSAAHSAQRLGIVSQPLSHLDQRKRGVPGPTPTISLSHTEVSG
jgi:tetratricopeptide (TPR) repeat protein